MENLITIKQLPIIEENLKSLSEEVDKKLENANSLVCTEETVKEVKKLRAEFNKEFKELETQRKFVKTEIEKPYKAFEEIYTRYISSKFKQADMTLSDKINEVESELKHDKELEVKNYFEELILNANIEFLKYEMLDINITLSASLKSLKEQVKSYIEKVESDLATIRTQLYADEIMVEYIRTLNLNQSIQEVTNRHSALEQLKRIEESAKETIELEEKTIGKVDEILQAPEVIEGQASIDDFEEKKVKITFTVYGTVPELKEVKDFLEKRGLKYEQCK